MDTITSAAPINPLRQRFQHDMIMRGLGPHTQQDYIRHVRRFVAFLGRPPDTATAEDLRNFQIHQHERGASSYASARNSSQYRQARGASHPRSRHSSGLRSPCEPAAISNTVLSVTSSPEING